MVQVKWIWLLQVVADGRLHTANEASVKNRADTLMNSGVCATSRTRYEGQFAIVSAVEDERAEKAASVVMRQLETVQLISYSLSRLPMLGKKSRMRSRSSADRSDSSR